jgi:hypothetical protein
LGVNLLGYPSTPRAVAVFAMDHREPFQLTADELLSRLMIVWTDRKVVRLVSPAKFDFKFTLA